jgi:hypothetical protein
VCVCADRHPLYASIRPGVSLASCVRGRRRGFGVAVGAAEGTDLGAVVGVAVGMDTAASVAVGPPNLPICLRGALDKVLYHSIIQLHRPQCDMTNMNCTYLGLA